MQKIEILIVGTNKPIMETIERLINRDGKWIATIAFTVDETFPLCLSKEFRLALICGGLAESEEIILKNKLQQLRPNLPVVKHYGGGSGLLFAEIYQGLQHN
jgi:hypothetical protein